MWARDVCFLVRRRRQIAAGGQAHSPTGSKGMSEGGVMGAIGTVMNAVNDALAPFGVVADRQPLSPDYIRSLIGGHS